MTGKRKIELLGLLLIILLAANWALGAWNEKSEKKQEEEAEAAKVYLTSLDDVAAYSYSNGDQTMSFTKEDGTWTYDDDTEIPMNQDTAQTTADTIRKLEAVRELADPDQLSDYGLEDPTYTISCTDSDGNTTTIYVGNGASEDYYATVDDGGKVYTVSSEFISSLQFDLSGVVKNDTVPTIGSGNLKKVTVTEKGTDTVYKDDDDLSELAGGFGTLSLTECADYHAEDDELKTYGLDESQRITVKAKYKDNSSGEKETFTVYVGGTDDSGENRYVMVDGSRLVYKVSTSVVQNMMTVEETADDSASE